MGGGKTQQTGDLRSRGELGIQIHAEAQFLRKKVQQGAGPLLPPGVIRIPDPGDGVLRAQFPRNETGEQVLFVRGGGGDQQIRLVRLGVHLNAQGSAAARHAHHVVKVSDLLDAPGVDVYGRNVVALLGETLGKLPAHHAAACDHDLHEAFLRFYSTNTGMLTLNRNCLVSLSRSLISTSASPD